MKGAHGQVSLAAVNGPAAYHGGEPYLDAVAELAWELLMAPELKRLGREGMSVGRMARLNLGMEYQRGFEVGGRRAREYFVNLERERGPVYVCADGERAYVVAALGAEADDARLKQFVDSFALKAGAASVSAPQGGGEGLGAAPAPRPGGNGGGAAPVASTGGFADRADYSRPFKHTEVTKKAAITAKPEPGFTEQARKFNVTGAVRLRAILNVSGSVQNIVVVKGLPHGLTEKSVAAARQIRFEPAQKDGRAVSQYVVLKYNFNIY
jgi:TonB family protein